MIVSGRQRRGVDGAAAVKRITDEHGAVGTLINNAAYSLNGTIGKTPMDEVRAQFETNVFGLEPPGPTGAARGMREEPVAAGVNIKSMSSIFGMFATPGRRLLPGDQARPGGPSATRCATRSQARFGIEVVLIQPGLIKTAVRRRGRRLDGGRRRPPTGPYGEFNARLAKATKDVYEKGPAAKLGGGPDAVANAIEKAITTKRPKARYLVTPSAHLLVNQKRLMPDRVWDAFLTHPVPAAEVVAPRYASRSERTPSSRQRCCFFSTPPV